ncbi:hypothetical protein GCM10010991_07620 [Gemmobacter aquaticus]|uniref:ATP-dependent Clp protease proteolytic subunit n=1 Tax=Gemmobacter aquaticus TaxID=490185 RepID=A0A917YJ69_9RHOB|nr:ClpP-like prohead protease/major capsid protein fusion protein [Gemmobacter aquaticus]GGO26707.1 hypothetical protein GCM10010991_07620 [Gemmobacter aquaticus]
MNEIRLYGSVGGSWWDEEFFTAAQVREQLDSVSGPLTVRINSGGGIASEGQAIYTMLVDYPDEVHVVIDAVAMSAASLIAMAGDTITMRLGSYMLVHDPANPGTDGRGTADDHTRAAKQLEIISRSYAAVYAKRAGISVEEARQIMRDETVMDGPTALMMGFATAVDEAVEAEPVARFDYRIYAHAPQSLREASQVLGAQPGKAAIVAMMSGMPRKPKQETTMAEEATETPAVEAAEEELTQTESGEGQQEEQPAPETVTASAADRQRAARIRDTVAMAGFEPTMALDMITRGLSAEQALAEVLTKRKEGDATMSGANHSGHRPATITADARDKFREGAERALMMKAGLKGGERNEFSSFSLAEMARECLIVSGHNGRFTTASEMVGHAFTMAGAHSTSDFGKILQNIQGKSALAGWDEQPETYPLFTRAIPLSDFKETSVVGLGLTSSLPKVEEGANYTYGTVSDRSEKIVLAKYGQLFRITREAILGDEMGMLAEVPRKLGRAARRTIGDLVFAVINGNPVMSDGVALFHATHANLAGTVGAPSVTTMSAARTAMRTQREKAGGPVLNIAPKYMLVPAALETVSMQLLTSSFEPTANKGHATNPVAGMAELIVDGRLDAVSSTAWYLAADQRAFDTIAVGYLNGVQEPFIEQQQMWTADGVEMKVRIDAGVAPLDFRTLYKNAGA